MIISYKVDFFTRTEPAKYEFPGSGQSNPLQAKIIVLKLIFTPRLIGFCEKVLTSHYNKPTINHLD